MNSMLSVRIILVALFSTVFFGCMSPPAIRENVTRIEPNEFKPIPTPVIGRVAYSVQVGAFSSPENAMRLEKKLRAQGLEAYYFRHGSGLYKVRFGDYPTYDHAGTEAAKLQKMGQIGDFFIISPEGHATPGVRHRLVDTATRFLGVPYSRGGDTADEGFDCSGLTMAVYRLNGFNLPRQSARQFRAGRPVDRKDLKKGDLVFFSTDGRGVSHVGLYIGNAEFIHAPRPGKTVRIANLESTYFKQRYVGARSYF